METPAWEDLWSAVVPHSGQGSQPPGCECPGQQAADSDLGPDPHFLSLSLGSVTEGAFGPQCPKLGL